MGIAAVDRVREALIAQFVVQRPAVIGVIDPAGHAVSGFAERRDYQIGVGAREGTPGRGRPEVTQRTRGLGDAVARVAVVLDAEAQVFRGVDQQVDGTHFADSGPVVIAGEAVEPRGQRREIVHVPVIVALAEVHAQVVKIVFANGELAAGVRVAAQAAERERVVVGETIFVLGFAEQAEVEQAEAAVEIEQLLIIGAVTADIGEAVARGDGTRVLKAADYPGLGRVVLSEHNLSEPNGRKDEKSDEKFLHGWSFSAGT